MAEFLLVRVQGKSLHSPRGKRAESKNYNLYGEKQTTDWNSKKSLMFKNDGFTYGGIYFQFVFSKQEIRRPD
jgi:hypothetical protein